METVKISKEYQPELFEAVLGTMYIEGSNNYDVNRIYYYPNSNLIESACKNEYGSIYRNDDRQIASVEALDLMLANGGIEGDNAVLVYWKRVMRYINRLCMKGCCTVPIKYQDAFEEICANMEISCFPLYKWNRISYTRQ